MPVGPAARKTSLLDRALNDLSDTAHGFFPAINRIGGSIGHDAARLASGNTSGFKLDNLGSDMAKGFWETSFIPGLLTQGPGEALRRANERPFSAFLDATLVAPAWRGAALGATKLGRATNDAAMFEWGAQTRGMVKADPMHRQQIVDALNTGSRGQLPATLQLADGGAAPMREYAPLSPKHDLETFGDDLWLRRHSRTLPVGAMPRVDDMAGSNQLRADFEAQRNVFDEGTTLSQDPWRDLMNYRSHNEQIAKLGDGTFNLLGKLPANKPLNAMARLGRKTAMIEKADATHDVDPKLIDQERLLEAIRASRPEFGAMDDDAFINAIGNDLFDRSMNPDGLSIDDAINFHDPEHNWHGLELEDLLAMSPQDARKHGLRVELTDEARYSGQVDDPYGMNYASMADFLAQDKHRLLDKSSPYKIRRMGKAHTEADIRARQARQEVEDAFGTLAKTARPGAYSITLHDLETGEVQNIDWRHMGTSQRDSLFDKVDDSTRYTIRVTPDTGSPLPNMPDEVGAVHMASELDAARTTIQKVLEARRAAQSELSKFDDTSQYYLKHNNLVNGSLEPLHDDQLPGVVQRLREIRDDPNRALINRDDPNVKALYELLDRTRDEGATVEAEKLKGLLTEPGVDRAKERLSEWAHGKPGEVEGNGFIPMMRQGKMRKGQYIANKRDDVDIEVLPTDRGAGDPQELFLSGDFRTDARVILDHFKKNREQLAGVKLRDRFEKMGLTVDDKKLAEMQKAGHVVTPGDLSKPVQGGWVLVDKTSAMADVNRKLTEDLNEVADVLNTVGLGDEARTIRQAALVTKKLNIGDEEWSVGSKLDKPGKRTGEEAQQHKIIPAELYNAAVKEIELNKAIMGGVLMTLTEGWKWMVLHTRFASWMRNNIIGAHMMAALSGGLGRYADSVAKIIAKDPSYLAAFKKVEADSRNSDVMSTGSASMARKQRIIKEDPEGMNPAQKVYVKAQNFFNVLSEFNAKWADNPTRTMRMLHGMEDQLAILNKLEGGKKIDIDEDIVERYMNDPELRRELARRTKTELVDFSDMSARERQVLVQIFPFWSWMKGSTKAGARVWSDNPGKVWAAGEMGQMGSEHLEDQHGRFIPEFAKTMFDPGESGGLIMNTAGFLPYQTPIDFTQMALGMIPGGVSYRQFGSENMLSNMNPFLSGAMQTATGRNTYFGTPIPNDGFMDTFLGTQSGLPLIKLGSDLIKNETGPDATSETSRGLTMLNYAGIPIRDPRWAQLHRRGVDEMNERYKSRAAAGEL